MVAVFILFIIKYWNNKKPSYDLENDEEEKEKIDCFTEVFKHAKLQDFFAPVSKNGNPSIFGIENWDEYYSITSNILHHFGLMQFILEINSH